MSNIISKGYSIASQVYGGITTINNFLGQYGPKKEIGKRKSIDGFVANQLQKDLARKAHFRVRIHPPNILSEDGWDVHKVNDRISMMASSTSFPDVAAVPLENSIGTDYEHSIVNGLNYATFDMTFLCDVEMTQRMFFEKWINSTYIKNSHNVGGSPTYYNNYIGSVEIYQLKHNFLDDAGVSEEEDWTYMNKFMDVYPASIAAMEASWDAGDFHVVSVTFNFKNYEVETPLHPQKMQESQLSTLT
jgi:hypothetical protein